MQILFKKICENLLFIWVFRGKFNLSNLAVYGKLFRGIA